MQGALSTGRPRLERIGDLLDYEVPALLGRASTRERRVGVYEGDATTPRVGMTIGFTEPPTADYLRPPFLRHDPGDSRWPPAGV